MRKTLILLTAFCLSLLGIVNTLPQLDLFVRQLIFVAISIILFLVVSRLNIFAILEYSKYLYWITIALLVGVLILGSGVRRWYSIGFLSFQPSELAKLIVPIYLLNLDGDLKKLLAGGLTTFLILIEPDLATSSVVLFITLLTIFLSTKNLKAFFYLISIPMALITSFSKFYFSIFLLIFTSIMLALKVRTQFLLLGVLSLVVVGITGPLLWQKGLKEYQRKRILAMIDPSSHPEKVWQVHQSRITLANSKLLGKGIYGSTQKLYGYLPAHHTDFAFTSVVETYGYVLGFLVIFLALFLVSLLGFGGFSEDKNLRNITLIACAFFTYQTFSNLSSVMGIIPVAGIPFPFLSYGGSHVLAEWMFLALVFSADRWKIE